MKTVTIEELLSWAFVHELTKGGGVEGLDNANSAWRMLEASSWGKITSFAELLTLVDVDRHGDANYWIEQGEPHGDAVVLGALVADLARHDVILPAGWNALSDWPDEDGLVGPAVARAVERYRLRPFSRRGAGIVSLVIGTAILGRVPDWEAPVSKVRMVERAGRPAWFVMKRVTDKLEQTYDIEVDGFNRRTGKPAKGAYRKFEFSDDPTGDILGRLDYQIWVAALRMLESHISEKLVDHRIVPVERSMTPWLPVDGEGVRLVRAVEARAT